MDIESLQYPLNTSGPNWVNMHDEPLVLIKEQFKEWIDGIDANANRGVLKQDGFEEIPDTAKPIDRNCGAYIDVNFPKGIAATKLHQAGHLFGEQPHELSKQWPNQLVRNGDRVSESFGIRFVIAPRHTRPPGHMRAKSPALHAEGELMPVLNHTGQIALDSKWCFHIAT